MISSWERAELLALVYEMLFGFLSLSYMVSGFRCGTSFYRFMIFAFFFSLWLIKRIVWLKYLTLLLMMIYMLLKSIWNSIHLKMSLNVTMRYYFCGLFVVIYVSCLFMLCCLVCSLQPCDRLLEKSWPLGSFVCCALCVLLLSHFVSQVRFGSTWLYVF